MAKRKTARSASRARTPAATRAAKGSRSTSSAARKTVTARPAPGRKVPARASTAGGARTSTAGRSGAKKTLARKSAAKSGTASTRSAAKGATDRRTTGRSETPTARGTRTLLAKRTAAHGGRPASGRSVSATTPPRRDYGRRGPGDRLQQIERDRRIVEEEVPTPPSSLDLDRRPSAARTGRAEIEERLQEHTAAGPDLTAGDVDADWEAAYSTGDEAPGGDMPTPDQAVVAEIGTAIGLEYADNEELKAVDKIEQRDRHRWELDPASSEDYEERARETKKG
jgi:Family of unknown function (DUF6335)